MKFRILLIAALAVVWAVQAAEELTPLVVHARIHLVQSEHESALNTTLTEDDIKRVLGKVNKIWAQAGIRIEAESICKTTAVVSDKVAKDATDRWVSAAMPKDSVLKDGINIYYVKELTPNGFFNGHAIFVKDTAKLKEVPNGLDEPLPRVTSHELGHALGLPHRQNLTNLMASGTTGFSLNDAEIETARKTFAEKYAVKQEPVK